MHSLAQAVATVAETAETEKSGEKREKPWEISRNSMGKDMGTSRKPWENTWDLFVNEINIASKWIVEAMFD